MRKLQMYLSPKAAHAFVQGTQLLRHAALQLPYSEFFELLETAAKSKLSTERMLLFEQRLQSGGLIKLKMYGRGHFQSSTPHITLSFMGSPEGYSIHASRWEAQSQMLEALERLKPCLPDWKQQVVQVDLWGKEPLVPIPLYLALVWVSEN